MKTSKPISTISYNSSDFLVDTLNRLKYVGLISYFELIEHLPDKDDLKKHFHVFIEPNKVLDTDKLSNEFLEDETTHSRYIKSDKLPLKCIAFRSSKFGDWYWYALHDKGYLKAKMLERNLHYQDSDILTSDKDTHRYLVIDNPLSKYAFLGDDALRELVLQAILDDKPLSSLLKSARIPIGKTQSVIALYNALDKSFSHSSNGMQVNSAHSLVSSHVNSRLKDIVNGSVQSDIEDFVFNNEDILF